MDKIKKKTKKKSKWVLAIVALILVDAVFISKILISIVAESSTGQSPSTVAQAELKTPTINDLAYIIPSNHVYDGTPQGIGEVKAKTGISGLGAITVKYNGNAAIPTEADTYVMTVDIAAGTNYAAATGLSLGNYTIAQPSGQLAEQPPEQPELKEPMISDLLYTIPTDHAYTGSPQGIGDVIPGPNVSGLGAITVKYNGNAVKPADVGGYAVTVDIAAGSNYTAVTDLYLGDYAIAEAALKVPTISDLAYSIPSNHTYNGSAQGIGTVKAKSGVSGLGTITVKYNGSTTRPTNAGTYSVTVDIATGTNYAAATGLSLGNYKIAESALKKPTASDLSYGIPSGHVYNGSAQGIGTVKAKSGISGLGTITVKYNGSTTRPTNAGTYTVTVDISAGTNYSAATGISLGKYTIAQPAPPAETQQTTQPTPQQTTTPSATPITPVLRDLSYAIPANHVYDGNLQGIGSVTAASGVSGLGTIKVKYDGSANRPVKAGTYNVTVDIAAGTNYTAATGLVLGSYTIAKATPKVSDLAYSIPGNHTYNGNAQGIGDVKAKSGVVGMGTVTVKYNGSTTKPTSAGTYNVTVDIAAGINYTAITGVSLGNYTIMP